MNSLRPVLALCALLSALPIQAATFDPLAEGMDDHEAQILGWSADGRRFVMRLYIRPQFAPRPESGPPPYCEGYVTHEGNYFYGGLVWLVYEKSKLLSYFPILDPVGCTPIAEAQNRLDDVKKQLGTLGIKLDTPGTQIVAGTNASSVTVSQGPQAPYTIEYEERSTPQGAPKEGRQRGSLQQQVYVHKGQKRQKVIDRKSSYEYATAMAGYVRTGLDRVWLSPSGSTVVVLGYQRVGNMAGGTRSLRLLGVLSWSGSTLKPL